MPNPTPIRWQRGIILGILLLMTAAAMASAIHLTTNFDILYRANGNIEIGTGRGLFWLGGQYVPATHDDQGHPGWTIRRRNGYGTRNAGAPLPWRWWRWDWYATPDDAFNIYQTRFPVWTFPLATTGLALYFIHRGLKLHQRILKGVCPQCTYPLSGLASNTPCPECGCLQPQGTHHPQNETRP